MRRTVLLGLLCLGFSIGEVSASPSPTASLRENYYAAAKDSGASKEFYEKMKGVSSDASPLELGYKGMSSLLRASHALNPLSKLSYFREGKELLETAIARDPNNLELRFLRYTVQDNAPFFLGYSGDMEKDREVITHQLATESDADLKKRINEYLQRHG